MSRWSWLSHLIDTTSFGLVHNFPIGFCWKQEMICPGQESREMGFSQSARDTGQTGATGFQFACPWPWSRTAVYGGSFAVILARCRIQLLCVETPLRRAFQVPRGWGMLALPTRYPTSQLRGPNPMFLTWFLFKWCFSGSLFCPSKKKSRSGSPSDYSSWY